jgi:hypothetical protein
MTVDVNNNVYVTGFSDKNVTQGISDDDFFTVAYNSGGTTIWSGNGYVNHEGTLTGGDDLATSMVLDGNGYLYVVGICENSGTHNDATVIKYDVVNGNVDMVKYFNGEGDLSETAKAIVADANGNTYAVGNTFEVKQNLNALLVKFDVNGAIVCNYQYRGARQDDDEFETVAMTTNGSVYAAGYTRVVDQSRNMLLVKFDASTCDTVWTWTYDFVGESDRVESMVLDAAGNVYLTGRSDANPDDQHDNFDIVTFKINSNGGVEWSQRYNGTGNLRDEPRKIILDNAGDVIVTGRAENVHDDDFITIKYNPSTGAPIWASPSFYGGPQTNDDRPNDITVDANNNIFVCGFQQTGSTPSPWDPVAVKYLPSGGVYTSFYAFVGQHEDEAMKIAADQAGNIYILYKYEVGPGLSLHNYDLLLKKFDNNLNEIWTNPVQYDSPIQGDDLAEDMVISPAGDVFLTASTEDNIVLGTTNTNWITLGYDPNGGLIFSGNWDGGNNTDDAPNAMVIGGTGPNLWVCGNSETSTTSQKDFTVNKYLLVTAISEPDLSNAANVYPNPFNTECKLTLKNNSTSSTLVLYDMLGNSVITPKVFEGKTVRIEKGNLSAGVYEYRVSSDNTLTARGKLIIK